MGICWFVPVGAANGCPQRWAWYALRFDGKAQNIGTLRAANGRPYSGIWIAARGRMRALSVTAKAVTAPPKGEPSLAALSKVVSSVWG